MANETFTLTLDGLGNTTDITINDTSQTPAVGESIFTTNGTFTVPANVTLIDIYAVGGGAGGQPGKYSSGSGGGGGGGGYFALEGMTVSSGDTFSVIVGGAGNGGSVSTNSPFETVDGASAYYPQSGTVTDPGSGLDTSIVWSQGGTSVAGGGSVAVGNAGGVGGGVSMASSMTAVTTTTTEKVGGSGNGNSGVTVYPGGGGGAGYGGQGGTGRGWFHRSTGGYNYHKAAKGGEGGDMHLTGGTTVGSTGTASPALGTGPYNYTGAGAGGNGGTATGNAYGHGGGGGAGGMIRDQTIYSGYYQYRYRWFLAGSGGAGGQGAVRFSYGG